MKQSVFLNRLRRLRLLFKTPEDPITALMKEQTRMIARGDCEPLGKILMVKTPAGWIQFQTGKGPAVGHCETGFQFIDTWDWAGLPDRYEFTDAQCPDCERVPCNECDRGKRICSYGTQIDCCGGSGIIAAQDGKLCKKCNGSGLVTCRKCLGTGSMTTGRKINGGGLVLVCSSCNGSGRERKTIVQNLADHQSKITVPEPYIAVGPITCVMLAPADNGPTQAWTALPDLEGIFPYFVSSFNSGSQVVILHGLLRATNLKKRTNS